MSKTKEQTWNEVYEVARKEFNNTESSQHDERMQCLQDRRFYSIAGAQWEGPLSDQYESRPKFEVNKILLAVIRIINEYRNNRISVLFVPKDGVKNDKLTDACNDLYRADEQDSNAEEAVDNAFEEAVGGGFGAYKLRHDYVDEDDEENEKQRIYWDPIFDADSCVYFDSNAKRQDKSDAKRAWVLTGMSREAYIEEWDDDPTQWPKPVTQTEFDWGPADVIYIAEYYVIEKTKKKLFIYRGLTDDEQTLTQDELDEDGKEDMLAATGFKLSRVRTIKTPKVHKYIMSGGGILEDCGYIAGKYIPVIPVYGKRWFIDNIERCMGHVRPAKDAQRLKNMQLSKLAEISAKSTVSKPYFTPQQIGNHGQMHADDNIKDFPYLLIEAIKDHEGNNLAIGPQAYTKPPELPQAMAALLEITEKDMQDLLGNQEAGEEIHSNTSGIAVELVQNKLDMQTFVYISNMATARKQDGRVWLSMAKEIYVEDDRPMKTVNQSGEVSSLELNKPNIDDDGAQILENDLTLADFDPNVEIGPTSASKRAATVRALTGMMSIVQDPMDLKVLSSMVMMNMEGEGISDVRDYYRQTLIKMGVVKPTPEEAEKLQAEQAAQPPDPNAEFLKAAATEKLANAEKIGAEVTKTNAQVENVAADTKLKDATTAATNASIGREDTNSVVDRIVKLTPPEPAKKK